jgi:hypothetical protein
MTMKTIMAGLGLAASVLCLSCGSPTTYGQTVQQQKRSMVQTPADQQARPPPSKVVEEKEIRCPTIAAEGSEDYAACEKELQNGLGVGGSGPADQDQKATEQREYGPQVRF